MARQVAKRREQSQDEQRDRELGIRRNPLPMVTKEDRQKGITSAEDKACRIREGTYVPEPDQTDFIDVTSDGK